jgi:hypothetical protein
MPDIYLIIACLVGVLERRKLEIKKTLMALGSAAGCSGFVEVCKFNLAPTTFFLLVIGISFILLASKISKK